MLLSQIEENALAEVDKLIDWHKRNNKDMPYITLNHKLYNALQRIAKKKLDKDLYRRIGDLEITATHYRGVEIKLPPKPRRSRRRKDTDELFS